MAPGDPQTPQDWVQLTQEGPLLLACWGVSSLTSLLAIGEPKVTPPDPQNQTWVGPTESSNFLPEFRRLINSHPKYLVVGPSQDPSSPGPRPEPCPGLRQPWKGLL